MKVKTKESYENWKAKHERQQAKKEIQKELEEVAAWRVQDELSQLDYDLVDELTDDEVRQLNPKRA